MSVLYRYNGSTWDVLSGPPGPTGATGPTGAPGTNGTNGTNGSNGVDGNDGWSPVFAVVSDGTRRVLQVVDWQGGEGTKPTTGLYVGVSGLVALIANGVDVRGATGAAGTAVVDIQQTEVDFGTVPTDTKTFTVTAGAIVGTEQINATQSGDAPTGRSADENEMDTLQVSARAASGSIVFIVRALDGPVVGKYKINYLVG